ncbi:DsbA family protein [Corynebacterium alimapuense]|uniref:Protein-disulfide isomerase n=1 Tax=Corynebacterium alimapuense TaxID=1576874 RepID=A0A3M8K7P0_9CORY|nr:DsbA family protein [Corynebacterium alimapuense]RNE48524.1 protein-disulfide isomerase [Corynebacterium alimapuense]
MATGSNSRSTQRNKWLVPAIIIAVAVLLIGMVLAMNGDSDTVDSASEQSTSEAQTAGVVPGQATTEAAQPDLTVVEGRDELDPEAVGSVDAPVGLVVFSDYQCHYCALWSADTLPAMLEHVEDGNLRIEWRNLALFGDASDRAARASYAAGLQGSFLEYHEALFSNGETRSEQQLSDESLTTLAGELGLDTQQFGTDFNSPETATAVASGVQQGIDLGVYSTPAFILGGQPIMGAQPTEVFENAFELALGEQE